jgi:hypothetical protein
MPVKNGHATVAAVVLLITLAFALILAIGQQVASRYLDNTKREANDRASDEESRARRTADEHVAALAGQRHRLDGKRFLQMPDRAGDTVPVFPDEAGLNEWISAESTGEARAAMVIFYRNHGVMVEPGVSCQAIDGGMLTSRVLILSGESIGLRGFVASAWIQH